MLAAMSHRTFIAAALALAAAAGAAQAQRIVIEPGLEVLAGEPLAVRLADLPAGRSFSLRSSRLLRDSMGGAMRVHAAEARFEAPSAGGTLDLATAPPLPGGSWSGADARGPFWSMLPAADSIEGRELNRIRFELKDDAGRVLDSQTLHLMPVLPGVQRRPAPGFDGAVFASLPGTVKRPALILLGGSEGGSTITNDAPRYASRGFAVLALPYYSPPGWSVTGPTPPELPGLPAAFADIPIDRLQAARDWLAVQPEVDASRIGLVGTSKGAEFALLAGTKFDWVRAIVAYVPSDVVWEGWGRGTLPGQRSSFAWQGKPLDFVPYKDFASEFAGFATGAPVLIRRPHDKGRAAHADRVAAARIPVEAIAAPVLVAGGHDDQIWSSGAMAEAIAATRAKAGRETVALVYRDAGHYLGGHGYNPTTQYNVGPMKAGGSPAADAQAQGEIFPAVMRFLQRVLGPVPR
jgi:dienelactone hydrolase